MIIYSWKDRVICILLYRGKEKIHSEIELIIS